MWVTQQLSFFQVGLSDIIVTVFSGNNKCNSQIILQISFPYFTTKTGNTSALHVFFWGCFGDAQPCTRVLLRWRVGPQNFPSNVFSSIRRSKNKQAHQHRTVLRNRVAGGKLSSVIMDCHLAKSALDICICTKNTRSFMYISQERKN